MQLACEYHGLLSAKGGKIFAQMFRVNSPAEMAPAEALNWGRLKSLDQLCGAEWSFLLVSFGTWLPIFRFFHLAVLHSCMGFKGSVSLPVSSSRIRQPPVPNKCSFYSCSGRNARAQMRAMLLNMQYLGQSSCHGHPQIQHPWSSWAREQSPSWAFPITHSRMPQSHKTQWAISPYP